MYGAPSMMQPLLMGAEAGLTVLFSSPKQCCLQQELNWNRLREAKERASAPFGIHEAAARWHYHHGQGL